MCHTEVFAVLYTYCNHTARQRYSGEVIDCRSASCGGSRSHACVTKCSCKTIVGDKVKVINHIHEYCASCKEAQKEAELDTAGQSVMQRFLKGEFGDFSKLTPRQY